jgi:hypothetical protein
MFFPHRRILAVLCVLLVTALLGIAASLLALAPERISRRTWKKHYTLYLQRSAHTEELVQRISAGGRFQGVVSGYTAEVSFNTFAGFASVPVYRLSDRLDSLDPRFDPYMQRVKMLFSIESEGSWEVVYLRSRLNAVSTYLYLRGLCREHTLRWRLLEFDPLGSLIRLLLFGLYLSAALRLSASASVRYAVLLGSLPWLFLVGISGYSALLAFYLMVPAWLHLFELLHSRWYDRSYYGRFDARLFLARPVLTLTAAVMLGILVSCPGPFAGVLVAMLGTVPATALLFCLFFLTDSRRAHTPYRALPILKRFRPRRRRIFPAIFPYFLLIVIAVGSYPALRLAAGLGGPLPQSLRMHSIGGKEEGLTWHSLSALYAAAGSGAIPNLADYVAHRAYQESVLFARPYAFPTMGERIRISEYRADSLRVHKSSRVVKQFKESWLPQLLEAAESGSIARLFADQGYAGIVEMGMTAAPEGRFLLLNVLVILFVIQFLLPGHFSLTPSILYATRNLTLRRH